MNWVDLPLVEVPAELSGAVGGNPLVAQVLARRGFLSADRALAFLDPAHYRPAPPEDLPDLEAAADRLLRAIHAKEQIAIWGDFDADGITATALLYEVLRDLGAKVLYRIPRRDEGHGVHLAGVQELIAQDVQLILTCDTGISAIGPLSHAKAAGIEAIVTDHHVPGDSYPPAIAVVNPHRLPPGHPMSTLSGVGVAYQIAKALDHSAADGALDLVALGLVADVSILTGDARYLVQRGLQALRQTARPGLRAAYDAAELRPEGITEEHIGFVLGPRLNALGRLAEAGSGVELLTTCDSIRARTLATELEGLNVRRQLLTKQVTDAALAQIEREPALLNSYAALVLSHPDWPGGILGIVAGRLAERYGRPAILISAPPDGLARGSGRSPEGVDLVIALSRCRSLLQEFGGHPGAAGFSIQRERIPELRSALSREVTAQAATALEPALSIDAYVSLSDLSLDLVTQINQLAPFGPGNPELTLAVRGLRLLSEATIGRTSEHRRVLVEDASGRAQTVLWWQGVGQPLPQGQFDLALAVRAVDYRGLPEVEIQWVDAHELEAPAAELPALPSPKLHDCRNLPDPERTLQALLAEGDLQVWAEGGAAAAIDGHNRHQLTPTTRLAIWTLPPGPDELQAALDKAQPREVFLFGQDAGLDSIQAFLHRLARLVKYALQNREGWFDLDKAATATAQRVSLVRAGLRWLAARGQVMIIEESESAWRLSRARAQADPEAAQAARSRLEALLLETSAYHAYLLSAPVSAAMSREPRPLGLKSALKQ